MSQGYRYGLREYTKNRSLSSLFLGDSWPPLRHYECIRVERFNRQATNRPKRLWHLKNLRIFLLLKLQEWQNIINESKFDDAKTEY